MKRSETPCPSILTDMFPIMKELWEDGCFDDYSDDHFIIKAIKDDAELVDNLRRHLANCTNFFPQSGEWIPETFIMNFAGRLQQLSDVFGKDKIKKFVKDQLASGKTANYDENQFFAAYSEILLLCYIAAFCGALQAASYEPRTGSGNHNPEASFCFAGGTRIDVEVKQPNFKEEQFNPKQDYVMPLLPMTLDSLKSMEEKYKDRNIEILKPRVMKLKDFINSACEKFQMPTNDNHYNILAINWSFSDLPVKPIFEPVMLLYNDFNGIFKYRSMAGKFGISDELYTKVSAIFVFKSSIELTAFSDLRYLFASRDACIMLNPFLLDTVAKQDAFKSTMQFQKNDFAFPGNCSAFFNIAPDSPTASLFPELRTEIERLAIIPDERTGGE